MNNIVYTAQVTGTASIFILFCIKFFIAIHEDSFKRSGRVAILWTTVYIFFLFALRLLQLLGIGSQEQLRIISGFASVIPTVAIIIHLVIYRNSVLPDDVLPSIQEAKAMLVEAKKIHVQAQDALNEAKKKDEVISHQISKRRL